ncbi:hypothetical protein EGW08_021550, partial [Elysia chlorotica]
MMQRIFLMRRGAPPPSSSSSPASSSLPSARALPPHLHPFMVPPHIGFQRSPYHPVHAQAPFPADAGSGGAGSAGNSAGAGANNPHPHPHPAMGCTAGFISGGAGAANVHAHRGNAPSMDPVRMYGWADMMPYPSTPVHLPFHQIPYMNFQWRPIGDPNAGEQLPMFPSMPCNVRGASQDTIERNTLPHKYTKV